MLITNNDVKADSKVISELVKVAETDPMIGFVTGKVYFYDRPDILQTVGYYEDDLRWVGGHIGNLEKDDGQYDNTEERSFTDDIFMLAKKTLFKTVGGYDTEFQFQAEPVENAITVLQKLKRAGHKIYFITSRPKQNQPLTFKWLRQNDIPFDGLEVIGHEYPKGMYGHKLQLDMFVDDLEKHLESMLHYKKRWRKGLLLLDKPWNMSYDGSRFVKVENWQEILRHVGIANR